MPATSLRTALVRAALSRRGLLGLAAVLVTAVTIAVAAAEPAGGQAPLECDGGLYLTTGRPGHMTLNRVDQVTGALRAVGDGGLTANGLAHNPSDDFLYGIGTLDPHHVVRVSADGEEIDLGAPEPMPAAWTRTYAGTFLPNGHYLVLGDDVPAPTPRGTAPATWAEIDVSVAPPRVVRTFSHPSLGNNDIGDVAFNPIDGRLYAFSTVHERIVQLDLRTGAARPIGPRFAAPIFAGSSFFDSFGRLWLYGLRRTGGHQDTLYRINDVGTGRPVAVAQGPDVIHSDGASCPFTIGMEKRVNPVIACAGSTVTYRATITNRAITVEDQREAGEAVTADFLDQLPADGRTFVAGSLVNPFGGEANDYGGTRRLRIDGLRIPHDSTATIEVDVALPPDLDVGTVMNQARLLALSGNQGAEVRSEYPGTPQSPDATPLAVHACADLEVTKSVSPTSASPGDGLTYTLRVTNHGPSAATGISSIADTLPDGLTFVAASAGGVSDADGTVRWPAMGLDAGAHRDLTVTATAAADVRAAAGGDGTIVNTASVRHPGDPDPDNDRDTARVAVARPDLVVDKDDGRRVVAPGDEVTYAIVVRNTGGGTAHGVVVTDELPGELGFVRGSHSPTRAETGRVAWPAFDLAAGAARELSVTARVRQDVPAGTVVRNVAAAPHPDDRAPGDNADDDRDEVQRDEDRPEPPDPVEVPEPPDDPPMTWLPRTGLAAASWTALGAGLVALGIAARWWGRPKPG